MNLFKLILDDTNEYLGQIKSWSELMPTLSRNERYRTILPAFTIKKLELTEDAGLYIKNAYELRGILAKTSIEIKRLNQSSNLYENYLSGYVDYAQYDRDNNESITSIGLDRVDLVSKWLNRDEIEVDMQNLIDLDGNDITTFTNETVAVNMHNQIYYKKVDLEIDATQSPVDPGSVDYVNSFTSEMLIQLGTNQTNINEIPEEAFNLPVAYVDYGQPSGEEDKDGVAEFVKIERLIDFDFDAVVDMDITVSYNFEAVLDSFTSDPNVDGLKHVDIGMERYYGKSGTKITTILATEEPTWVNTGVGAPAGGPWEASGTLIVSRQETLNSLKGDEEGESLKLWVTYRANASNEEGGPHAGNVREINVETLDIQVNKEIVYPETTCNSMLVYEAFLRSLQKMTGVNDPLRSTFYGRTDSEVKTYAVDGAGSKRAVSNVFQLRQFPLADRPIYTDFVTLFRIFNALDNIAVGLITESDVTYIAIEPIEYFLDNSKVAFVVTDPSNFKEVPALRYLFSLVKFGNTKYEEQKETILRSPHTPRSYTTGLDEVVKNPYEIENPAILSGHLIEQLRQQPYVDAASKDTLYDNDLVVISVVRDSTEWDSEKDDDFTSITGVEFPEEQYNMKLTPLRSLIAHTSILAGGAKRFGEQQAGKVIRFQKGFGNIEVITQLTTETSTVSEKENISESEGLDPLFIPDFQTYQVPITKANWDAIMADPNQVIEVSWRGATYKGFLENLTLENPDSLEADFKCLTVYES